MKNEYERFVKSVNVVNCWIWILILILNINRRRNNKMKYNPYEFAVSNFPVQSKVKRKYKIISYYSELHTWYKVMIYVGGMAK